MHSLAIVITIFVQVWQLDHKFENIEFHVLVFSLDTHYGVKKAAPIVTIVEYYYQYIICVTMSHPST